MSEGVWVYTPNERLDEDLEALCGLPGVQEVVDCMPTGMEPLAIIGFLLNRKIPECFGVSPLEWIVSGKDSEEVKKIAADL